MIVLKSYEETRVHFIQRIKERYNIILLEDEYDALLKQARDFDSIYKINSNTKLVLATIKGEKVFSIYKKGLKEKGGWGATKTRLLTCLKLNGNNFPCPHSLLRKGIKKEDFEIEMNLTISKVMELSKEIEKVGRKEFFLNNTSNQKLKKCAVLWYAKGVFDFHSAVKYIEYKLDEKRILDFVT